MGEKAISLPEKAATNEFWSEVGIETHFQNQSHLGKWSGLQLV